MSINTWSLQLSPTFLQILDFGLVIFMDYVPHGCCKLTCSDYSGVLTSNGAGSLTTRDSSFVSFHNAFVDLQRPVSVNVCCLEKYQTLETVTSNLGLVLSPSTG